MIVNAGAPIAAGAAVSGIVSGAVSSALTDSPPSFVALLARQPHESALTVPVAEQLSEAELEPLPADRLHGMLSERLPGKLPVEWVPADAMVSNLKQIVQDRFNSGSDQDRLAIRAVAGSLWAGEELDRRFPDHESKGSAKVSLLGYPGAVGENVDSLLEQSAIRFLSDFELEAAQRATAAEEELDLGGKNFRDRWRLRKVIREMKKAQWAELEGKTDVAFEHWNNALRQLKKTGAKKEDGGLLATLYMKAGELIKAANYFQDCRAREHAVLALLLGAGSDESPTHETLQGAVSMKNVSIREKELKASSRMNRPRYGLNSFVEPGLITIMLSLYREALRDAPTGSAKARLFAEMQVALGQRLSQGFVFHAVPDTPHSEIDGSAGYFLGARHLLEAAAFFALDDVDSYSSIKNPAQSRADLTLRAALHAMEGKIFVGEIKVP